MLKKMIPLLLVPFLLLSCANPILYPREGFVQVPGGPVWYRVFGSGTATPLLMVHGGPGIRSCYFERLAILLSQKRPVILYDQLGTGRSGRPMDRSLWTVERFVRELAEVRESLGLAKVHLLGHSWGSALVTTYVLKTHPQGVESITLASPYLSTRLWNADAARLRAQLPPEVQQTLERHERAGTLQSPEYQEAVGVYHDRHLFHRKVEPIPSCAEAPKNNEIYQRMWGGSDFYSTGVLKDFDLIPYLEELKNPVLLLTGRYDTARPETAALLQTMIPGARLSILENSAHMGPMEEPERMSELIETFLRDIELSASR